MLIDYMPRMAQLQTQPLRHKQGDRKEAHAENVRYVDLGIHSGTVLLCTGKQFCVADLLA
jgi:hypothetical protein